MMKNVLIKMIRFYKKYLSPLMIHTHCIYTPTCSQYAIEALEKYGVWKGGWLTVKRLARCNPFNRNGGFDPVP